MRPCSVRPLSGRADQDNASANTSLSADHRLCIISTADISSDGRNLRTTGSLVYLESEGNGLTRLDTAIPIQMARRIGIVARQFRIPDIDDAGTVGKRP